jgi:hypothetical protein
MLRNYDPEKYVLVPKKLTPEMLEAGRKFWLGEYIGLNTFLRTLWIALLEEANKKEE